MNKVWYGLLIAAVVAFFSFLVWYIAWVSFVENYEYGFTYNKFTGEVKAIGHTGWVVATPWKYSVHAIDTRPYQISITADIQSSSVSGANQRVLNAKLVRFNPSGLKTFIEWHGRGAGDNLGELKEILKCYAFDRDEGRDCPFLEVVSVLAPSQGMSITKEVDIKPIETPVK
jgi:hypothetical protein